jgi:chemotaxis protein MotB
MRRISSRSSHASSLSNVPFVLCLATPLLLGACVTRSSFDEVTAERDSLAQANRVLASKTVALTATTGILIKELALQDLELAELEREQRELADDVARWMVMGAVKMMMLADGLHVLLPHEVLFESGASTLSAQGETIVKELVAEISQHPYEIAVVGFTDNVPIGARLADRYASNWELAGLRAAGVVRVMQREGIPIDQMLAVSRGEGRPIASNDTPEGRAENRRIDVRLRPIVNE